MSQSRKLIDQIDPDFGLPGWVDVGMDMMDVDRDGIVAAGGFVEPGELVQWKLPYDQVLIRDPFMVAILIVIQYTKTDTK